LSAPRRRARCAAVLVAAALVLAGAAARAADVRVEIEGLDEPLTVNARAHLSLVAYTEIPDLGETNVRALHARAPDELRAALEPFGYYAPDISTSLTREGTTWVARYVVSPGEPVVVTSVDMRITGHGADEPGLRAPIEQSKVAQGAPLRHGDYERTKGALLAAALEHGYRDAVLAEHRIDIDVPSRSAAVRLRLETGRRYRFGELSFDQDVLRDDVLRRYVTFAPGDPYDAKALLELQYALYDSGYFGSVEVEPGAPEGDQVPIVVRAEPRLRHTYRFGVGYGTDTRARVSFGYENRRLNSRGHRAALDLTLSSPKQDIEAQYVVPLDRPVTDTRALAAHATEEELGDTRSRKVELIARDTRLLGTWQRQLYVRLANERTDIADVASTSTHLVPGTQWTRTRSDDPILPMRGSYVGADLHGTGGALGADTTFLRLRLDGRLLRPLGARGRAVARLTVGTSVVGEFDALPASERFFAGGDQSVRGFDLNSLGPRDEDGQVVGGKHLLAGSFEYEHRLRGPWGVAVFVDGGNALDDFGDDLEYGAGVGARYRSPLGMLRFDIAWPLTEGDDGLHLHFGFGPEL
jgi:translocation and assembly module TamA